MIRLFSPCASWLGLAFCAGVITGMVLAAFILTGGVP